jgi:hypothetical protein
LKIIAGEVSWAFGYNPEMQLTDEHIIQRKKLVTKSWQVTPITFSDSLSVVHQKFVHVGQ